MPLSYRRFAPLLLLALVLTTTAAHAVTRTVELDGSGDFTVIQDALLASTVGDTVLVGPGVYTWTNQGSGNEFGLVRFWLRDQDGVHLVSTDGPEATIIDAEGQGRVLFANGGNIKDNPVDFLVKGFTLRNGYAYNAARAEQEGGNVALHLCQPVFDDCIIEGGLAEFGGGVWMGGVGYLTMINCRFYDNRAEILKPGEIDNVGGGGVFIFGASTPDYKAGGYFEGCTFIGNHSDYRGGGFFAGNDSVQVIDCLFAKNTVPQHANRNGTAIYAFNPQHLVLDGVTVRDHVSSPGGAVYLLDYFVAPNPNPVTSVEVRNTLVAKGVAGNGQMIDSRRIDNLDISCTNIHGGSIGNWVGQLLPFRGVAGNLQVDPEFCSEWGNPRMVSGSSPMLAAHNSCGTDIGRVLGGDCITVPVLASGLTVHRDGAQAVLSWQGVDPVQAGLSVDRIAEGNRVRLPLAETMIFDGTSIRLVDVDAPRSWVEYRLLDPDGQALMRAELPAMLAGVRLLGASPNPFNPRTEISFEIDRAARVRLDLYDARGRHVRSILDEMRGPGAHTHSLDASDLGSGVYHLRLNAAGQVRTESVVLVR
jgi:hypothetical protein